MKNIFLTSVLALFGAALAAPDVSHSPIEKRHGCLTDGAAHKIVHRWIDIFEGRLDLLDKTVTNHITVEDESVSFLFGLPPGPYAVGKKGLKDSVQYSLSQPGTKNLKIKSLIILHDCDTISFRYQITQQNTGLDPNSWVTYSWPPFLSIFSSPTAATASVGAPPDKANVPERSTAKAGDPIAYKGTDILEIQKGTGLIKRAYTSADYLRLIYQLGVKLCFQKDAPQPVCSA